MNKTDVRSQFKLLDDALLLTPVEVGELLAMTKGALYQSLHRGQLPAPVQRQRGRLRWSVGQVRDYLQKLEKPTLSLPNTVRQGRPRKEIE